MTVTRTLEHVVIHSRDKAEQLQNRLKSVVSDKDDLLVVIGGTNNLPVDSVSKCIRNIDNLVTEAIKCNPTGHLLISENPLRVDGNYMVKVNEVNDYIKHLCSKYDNVQNLSHALTRNDLGNDGLHLNIEGKSKIGDAIREVANTLR